MKKRPRPDQSGGPASTATAKDLASALADLAQAERLRARATVALARVRARGDGEAAVGMPVSQHVSWNVNVRQATISSLGTVTDVAGDLPTVMDALADGTITFDQACAIAWPAARVGRAVRRALDRALAADRMDGWQTLAPEHLEAEIARLLDELRPELTEQEQREREQREWLHRQATLDGQGLDFAGHAHGENAALINAVLDQAAGRPVATVADPDGPTRVEHTEQSRNLFDGLMDVFRHWATSSDTGGQAAVTLLALVDERNDATGSGEWLTERRGLAPRLTPTDAADLRRREQVRRIEVQISPDGEPVAITGRTGHVAHDPESLSDDTIRILCRVRDAECRMPGCQQPAEHLHHLVWRALARSRGRVAPDDPRHRVWLCHDCHRLVHEHGWAGNVATTIDPPAGRGSPARGDPGAVTWSRAGPTGRSTARTTSRLARRLRPPPPEVHPDRLRPDHQGDPLPF